MAKQLTSPNQQLLHFCVCNGIKNDQPTGRSQIFDEIGIRICVRDWYCQTKQKKKKNIVVECARAPYVTSLQPIHHSIETLAMITRVCSVCSVYSVCSVCIFKVQSIYVFYVEQNPYHNISSSDQAPYKTHIDTGRQTATATTTEKKKLPFYIRTAAAVAVATTTRTT